MAQCAPLWEPDNNSVVRFLDYGLLNNYIDECVMLIQGQCECSLVDSVDLLVAHACLTCDTGYLFIDAHSHAIDRTQYNSSKIIISSVLRVCAMPH